MRTAKEKGVTESHCPRQLDKCSTRNYYINVLQNIQNKNIYKILLIEIKRLEAKSCTFVIK